MTGINFVLDNISNSITIDGSGRTISNWSKTDAPTGCLGLICSSSTRSFVTLKNITFSNITLASRTGIVDLTSSGGGHLLEDITINTLNMSDVPYCQRSGGLIGGLGSTDQGSVTSNITRVQITGLSISRSTSAACSGLTVYGSVGGLIGLVGDNNVSISNVVVSGTITSTVAGYTWGDVNGFGGLIGGVGRFSLTSNGLSVSRARTNVTISSPGGDSIGGIIGGFFNSSTGAITESKALGNISVTATSEGPAGGLIGTTGGGATITKCAATGNVTKASGSTQGYAGGLIGSGSGTVSNSYARGTVATSNNIANGGLVGRMSGLTISKSYSSGTVNGNIAASNKKGFVGVVASGTASNSFFDSTKNSNMGGSGITGATGEPTANMQTLSTFTAAGWDFAGESANGTDDIWCYNNGEYPYLCWMNDLLSLATISANTHVEIARDSQHTYSLIP